MLGLSAGTWKRLSGGLVVCMGGLTMADDAAPTALTNVVVPSADEAVADATQPSNVGAQHAVSPISVAGVTNEPANEAVRLVYKFSPGQFVKYDVTRQLRYVTTQSESTFDALQSSAERKHFRVVSLEENGSAWLEPVIEHVQMSARLDKKPTVSFDSRTDSVAPRDFKGVLNTIGRPMARFLVEPTGNLLKVVVVSKDPPKSLVDAAAKTDRGINFLTVLPAEAIKVGYRWKENYEVSVSVGKGLSQQIALRRQYELVSVKDGIATIKFRTVSLAPGSEPEITRQLVQQTPSGVIEFDIRLGLIRSQTSKIGESVVGAFGPQTVLQVVGESTEKLVVENTGIRQVSATEGE